MEWISVAERLPEIDMSRAEYSRYVRVLGCYPNGYVTEMRYESNGFAKTEKGRLPKWKDQRGSGRSAPDWWTPMPAGPVTPPEAPSQ